MRCGAIFIAVLLTAHIAGCGSTRGPKTSVQQAGLVRSEPRIEVSDESSSEKPVRLVDHEQDESAGTDWVVVPESNSEPQPLIAADNAVTDLQSDTPVDGLSLDHFQQLALEAHPSLQHRAAYIAIAEGKQIQAGLYPNPTIGYHGMNIGSRGTAGRQSGFFQQRIVTGGKLQLDQQIACREVEHQRSLLSAARQRVLTDVRTRFYEALVAQRREELTDELVGVINEIVDSTRTLLRGGQATENALLQAEIEVEQANILKDNASNAYAEAWRLLCVATDNPDMPVSYLDGDFGGAFVERDLDLLTEQIFATHPLLIAAQARVERTSAAIVRAEREVIPDLNILLDGARTNQTKSNTVQARIGVEVPLWDKNQGNILSAQGELAAARTDQRRIELLLRQKLATVFRQYANALHQATRYRDRILPRAERSLELVRQGYDNGQVEYLTLLNSQQKFVQANLAYIDALETLQTSAALLDGQLLDDSLSGD